MLMTHALRLLNRFADEEAGQDLIEYALLTGAIGLCAVAAFGLFGGAIFATYNSWTASTNGLWQPPPPSQ
jgi:Flp pilus assembly pilin Flp